MVAHQRADRAGSSKRYPALQELPFRLLTLVRKLDAVDGNRLPKESSPSWLRKLDTIEGNRLLRACRKRLRILAKCWIGAICASSRIEFAWRATTYYALGQAGGHPIPRHPGHSALRSLSEATNFVQPRACTLLGVFFVATLRFISIASRLLQSFFIFSSARFDRNQNYL